jgi:hypothetical protein
MPSGTTVKSAITCRKTSGDLQFAKRGEADKGLRAGESKQIITVDRGFADQIKKAAADGGDIVFILRGVEGGGYGHSETFRRIEAHLRLQHPDDILNAFTQVGALTQQIIGATAARIER